MGNAEEKEQRACEKGVQLKMLLVSAGQNQVFDSLFEKVFSKDLKNVKGFISAIYKAKLYRVLIIKRQYSRWDDAESEK